jgi:hypothetical protein
MTNHSPALVSVVALTRRGHASRVRTVRMLASSSFQFSLSSTRRCSLGEPPVDGEFLSRHIFTSVVTLPLWGSTQLYSSATQQRDHREETMVKELMDRVGHGQVSRLWTSVAKPRIGVDRLRCRRHVGSEDSDHVQGSWGRGPLDRADATSWSRATARRSVPSIVTNTPHHHHVQGSLLKYLKYICRLEVWGITVLGKAQVFNVEKYILAL